tara:strand:- start:116 stop:472 length:357 start_codon:yes stop_codon:yes gene_type:complete
MGDWVGPGIGDVGSYQVSGIPFVFEGAQNETKTATLKYVTSEIQVNSTGAGNTISFGDSVPTTYTLPAGLSTFRVKCKSIQVIVADVLNNAVSVCVSLTPIEAKHMSQHTQTDFGTVA